MMTYNCATILDQWQAALLSALPWNVDRDMTLKDQILQYFLVIQSLNMNKGFLRY